MQNKRIPIIAANWKMHMTNSQAKAFLQEINPICNENAKVILFVPATTLHSISPMAKEKNISLGLQNMHWEDQGAFTGEISANMLLEAGANHVIIGHSERRFYFGETDLYINLKVRAAQRNEITPIICIGESLEQRSSGTYRKHLCSQIVSGLISTKPKNIILAYEPIWAIGSGKTATLEQVEETMNWIKQVLHELLGTDALDIPLLYGGSVNTANISSLFTLNSVDGFLIGGASLIPKNIIDMIIKLN